MPCTRAHPHAHTFALQSYNNFLDYARKKRKKCKIRPHPPTWMCILCILCILRPTTNLSTLCFIYYPPSLALHHLLLLPDIPCWSALSITSDYPTLPPFASIGLISPIGPIGPIFQIPPKFHLNTSDCTIGRPLDGLRKTSRLPPSRISAVFRFALQRYDEHLPFSKQNRKKNSVATFLRFPSLQKYTEYTKYT